MKLKLQLFRWQLDAFIKTKAKFNIIPAGRRTGKTQGGERAAIYYALQGDACLWIDTVNANIDRYVERYFIPDLQENPTIKYEWNQQKKILKIGTGYIDFRSADRPENIEGFGYHKIFLNEAGIILNNDYLYTNTILPMLMDFEQSMLFAFGTPKGKQNKKGEEHRYYTLWKKVLNKDANYAGMQLSSYDNPILTKANIDDLKAEIAKLNPEAVEQEIYGKFTDSSQEAVFRFNELAFFNMEEFNDQYKEAVLASIDVADEGIDSFSMPIGYLVGNKIFITDWLFSKENTNFTVPASAELMRHHRIDYCAIETNNHGSVVFKDLEQEVSGTSLLPVHQQTKKHSRIIQNAGFVRDYFVFRNDYEVNSDYDKAMRQLLAYAKDGSIKEDDSPDSIALLAAIARDIFSAVWYN